MGCVQSKIEYEETVSRCKERKQQMERAVTSRNKLAAAHVANAVSLKNTGAALSDFALIEANQLPTLLRSSSLGESSSPTVIAGTNSQRENLPPPPPPLPLQFNNVVSPLQRAASMPAEFLSKPGMKVSDPIIEEDNEDDNSFSLKRRNRKRREQQQEQPSIGEPPWDFFDGNHVMTETEELVMTETEDHEMAESEDHEMVDPEIEKKVEVPVIEVPQPTKTSMIVKKEKQRSLTEIFMELDNCFLKASESAHEVSRMLEATRLHYHSNFADKGGTINHSERVMRVITWNRSFKGLPNGADKQQGELDSEENETHASVLEKMLAWEKKLYEEVKAGELMKREYLKKVAALSKLKKHSSNTEALERTKAAVSHMHTRYIVDMQSMESTVTEINGLRDYQLYPKLVTLVAGMTTMWEEIRKQHLKQTKIVEALKQLDANNCPKETTEYHHDRTHQLSIAVQDWHKSLCDLMTHQKGYISALNSWLKLNLIPIDLNWKGDTSSPDRTAEDRARPILHLLSAWHDHLLKLQDEPIKAAISNFAAVVKAIWEHQKEELQFRNKCEEASKILNKKTREFEHWHDKYLQKRTPPDEMDPDRALDKDLIAQKQREVEAARIRLKEDEEAYERQCIQVRDKSLMSLKTHLPQLFRALSEFSHACSNMYTYLRSLHR